MPTCRRVYIGVAGWNIPKTYSDSFGVSGSHLERYAQTLNAVEINTSFYRPHRRSTYARWAETVPEHFRFCVKAPRTITHHLRLSRCDDEIATFVDETRGLGEKLGCLLIQLPPSLRFDLMTATSFLASWRASYEGSLVCEPRHTTWFAPDVEKLFIRYQVGRVAADPKRHLLGMEPSGYRNTTYFRLHGAPKTYHSRYNRQDVAKIAKRITEESSFSEQTWCIFDNTAEDYAIENALQLRQMIEAD